MGDWNRPRHLVLAASSKIKVMCHSCIFIVFLIQCILSHLQHKATPNKFPVSRPLFHTSSMREGGPFPLSIFSGSIKTKFMKAQKIGYLHSVDWSAGLECWKGVWIQWNGNSGMVE